MQASSDTLTVPTRAALSAAATAAALFLLLLPAFAAAAPGDLDPSYGTGGRATVDLGEADFGQEGELTPDGRLYVAGQIRDSSAERDFGLARLTADGQPDPAFGGGSGFSVVDPTPGEDDWVRGLAIQDDGKPVVGGYLKEEARDAGLVRFDVGGLPDAGFGTAGIARLEHAILSTVGGDVIVLPGGKLLWVGRGSLGEQNDLFLVRFHPDGSLDESFGSGGARSHSLRPPGETEQYSAVAMQPDGKILVGGEVQRPGKGLDFAVVRLHPNGDLDTSFNGVGYAIEHIAGNDFVEDVVVQPDGRIVVAGTRNGLGDFALVRYLPDGSLDPTFSGNGRYAVDLGGGEGGYGAVVQPDGKIAIAGTTDATGDKDMAVHRVTAAGVADASFGVGGTTIVDFGGDEDEGRDLVLQDDGKLIVVGLAVVGGEVEFAAARLEGDPPPVEEPGDDGDGGGEGEPDPAPEATPPADEAVALWIGGRAVVNRRGVALARVYCPAREATPPCRGRLLVMTRGRFKVGKGRRAARRRIVLARGAFRVPAGKVRVVRMRVGKGKLRLLKRSRRARRVVALAAVRDGAGNRRVVRKQVGMVPQRRKAKRR